MSKTRQALESLRLELDEALGIGTPVVKFVKLLVRAGFTKDRIIYHAREIAAAIYDDDIAPEFPLDELGKKMFDRIVHRRVADLLSEV